MVFSVRLPNSPLKVAIFFVHLPVCGLKKCVTFAGRESSNKPNMSETAAYPTATLESVWAAFRETDRQMKETDRLMKESSARFEREMKELRELTGSWAHNHGTFAEEYFANSFEKGKCNFFGEKFDRMERNVCSFDTKIRDEYDILLINGKSVAIIEVKYKAHENDLPKVSRKAETFRVNYPKYANHQIYLGLASLSFYPQVEAECINQGIAVIKQVGETVVINDAHLKVF